MENLQEKTNLLKFRFIAFLTAMLLVIPMFFASLEAEAASSLTPAGTSIINEATATYEDAAGNTYDSDSGAVTTTVLPVYGFTLTPDSTDQTDDNTALDNPGQQKNSSPASQVTFQYTLIATGNDNDTFNISYFLPTVGSSANLGEVDFLPDLTTIQIYWDEDDSGDASFGDTLLYQDTDGDGNPDINVALGPLDPYDPVNDRAKIVVVYTMPSSGVTSGDITAMDIQGESVNDNTITDTRNYNETTWLNDAIIEVNKGRDVGVADPGDTITYDLTINNTGNATATSIEVIDTIPTNTTFEGTVTAPGDVTVTYSEDGGTNYIATPTNNADVTHIKFALASLAASNNRIVTFKVLIDASAPASPPTIDNTVSFTYTNNAGAQGPETSNTVSTTVSTNSAVLISPPLDDGFTTSPKVVVLGTDGASTDTSTADVDNDADNTDAETNLDGSLDTGGVPDQIADDQDDKVAANSEYYFKNIIFNMGNADDTFDITKDSSSVLPSGGQAVFFRYTDTAVGSKNTSTLTNTGTIPARKTATAATTAGNNTLTVADTSDVSIGDIVLIQNGTNVDDAERFSVTAIPDGTTLTLSGNLVNNVSVGDIINIGLTIVTRVDIPAGASDALITAVVKATSTNGGTALGTNIGEKITDTTINAIVGVQEPGVALRDLINLSDTGTGTGDFAGINTGTDYGPDTSGRRFSLSEDGGKVAYPLQIYNSGGSNDTFTLDAAPPAGYSNQFFAIITSTNLTVAATAGDTSVTVNDVTNLGAGDQIAINGQILTIGSVTDNVGTGSDVITFSGGETLAFDAVVDDRVDEPGPANIANSGTVSSGGTFDFLSIISVPAGESPTTAPHQAITYTAESSNNNTITDTITDRLLVPTFREFSLISDRTGSAPLGGTLFYGHTLTNDGNADLDFNITVAAGAKNFSYTLLSTTDGSVDNILLNSVQITTSDLISAGDTITIPAGKALTFNNKVFVPTTKTVGDIDIATVTAADITSITGVAVPSSGQSIINSDRTEVVDGFIDLNKSVENCGTDISCAAPTSGATAKPGEYLRYTIEYTNIGTEDALKVKIIDRIPDETTYQTGTIEVEEGASGSGYETKTDAQDDNTTENLTTNSAYADYNVSTVDHVTVYVGTGATQTTGGTVSNSGGEGRFRFIVQVK